MSNHCSLRMISKTSFIIYLFILVYVKNILNLITYKFSFFKPVQLLVYITSKLSEALSVFQKKGLWIVGVNDC